MIADMFIRELKLPVSKRASNAKGLSRKGVPMRIAGCIAGVALVALLVAAGGCISEEQFNDLKAANRVQQQRIASLEGELNAANVMLSQLQKKLETCEEQNKLIPGAKDAEIAALEKAIAEQKDLIARLQAQLLKGPVALPLELNEALQQFAEANKDLVSFDESTGVLKFKSDLLFAPGSAKVEAKPAETLATLCKILAGGEAANFDIIVAGHTDDQPIKFSKAQHETNWHLSAHRAISVLQVMESNKIAPKRISVRGFGEFRPAAANEAGNKGNAANRRVEIYIVSPGA